MIQTFTQEDPSIDDLVSTVQDTNDTVPVASGIISRRKRQLANEPYIWEKGIIPVSFTAGSTQECKLLCQVLYHITFSSADYSIF